MLHFPLLAAFLISLTSASSPSTGCGKNLKTSLKPGGPSKYFNFDSNAGKDAKINIKRRVRIALPKNYKPDTSAPVVLAFHPKHRNGTSFEIMTQLSNSEINVNAITVFPDGVDLFWTGDPWAPHTDKNNDIKFAGELLDQIQDNFCVDRSRVYAAGLGNGGGLAHLIACDPAVSKRFAAFAVADGAVWTDEAMKQRKAVKETLFNPERCKPARVTIPMINIHNDADEIIQYGGDSFEGPTEPVPNVLKHWVERNGCDASKGNKTTTVGGGRVIKYSYDCEENGKPLVLHYLLHGGEHDWPSIEMSEDEEGFDGSAEIMNFFNEHELPEEYVRELDAEALAERFVKAADEVASKAQAKAEESGDAEALDEAETATEFLKNAVEAAEKQKMENEQQGSEPGQHKQKGTHRQEKPRDEL